MSLFSYENFRTKENFSSYIITFPQVHQATMDKENDSLSRNHEMIWSQRTQSTAVTRRINMRGSFLCECNVVLGDSKCPHDPFAVDI